MKTFAELVTKKEALEEYRRLVAEGYSTYEAAAMVYKEPAPDEKVVKRNGLRPR